MLIESTLLLATIIASGRWPACFAFDPDVDIKDPYRCAMRGICGRDGDLHQNCFYDGPPMPVPFGQDHHYKQLCPQLFEGDY